MIVFLKLLEPLGYYLGPTFSLTPNVGSAIPSTATRQQLLTGINVIVPDGATHIKIKSLGEQCSTEVEYPIGIPTTTTTTIAPPTTTTTTSGLTTTTTTTSNLCLFNGGSAEIIPPVEQPCAIWLNESDEFIFQMLDQGVYNGKNWFSANFTPVFVGYGTVYFDGTKWVASLTSTSITPPAPALNIVSININTGVGLNPPTTSSWTETTNVPFGSSTIWLREINNSLCITTTTSTSTSTSSTSTTTAPVYYTFGDSGRGNSVPEACSDSVVNARTFYSNCDSLSFGAGCFVYIDNIGTALSGYTVLVMNGITWDIDDVTGFVYGSSAIQC